MPPSEAELFRQTGLTGSERSLRAKRAANARWLRELDRIGATAPARAAALKRFEDFVDPQGVMTPDERRKLARNAQMAHMQGMALKREKARRRNGGTK